MRKLISNLIRILMFCTVTSIYAQDPEKLEFADEKSKAIINQYVSKLSDIQDMYVVNQRLSKAISPYFKHKVDLLPLYKINLKIDRNPIKIPWTLGESETDTSIKKRVYHIEPPKSNTN